MAEGTEARIAMCVFGSVFLGVVIGAAVPLIESLPSFRLLPWRLWKSATLRNLKRSELREQFGTREFLRTPPAVFRGIGADICFGDIFGGLLGALRCSPSCC